MSCISIERYPILQKSHIANSTCLFFKIECTDEADTVVHDAICMALKCPSNVTAKLQGQELTMSLNFSTARTETIEAFLLFQAKVLTTIIQGAQTERKSNNK